MKDSIHVDFNLFEKEFFFLSRFYHKCDKEPFFYFPLNIFSSSGNKLSDICKVKCIIK